MRAEQPFRTPVSEFQTEPYSASYGQNTFWRVPAQMGPIYNRIHLDLGVSPELPPQNDSVANSLFSGPMFDPKKVTGPKCQPQIQKSNPGLKNPPLGMKKQKMRAEKQCRTPVSEFQTEPYSANYGQKQCWLSLIHI